MSATPPGGPGEPSRASAVDPPHIDPTPIFESFRGSYGTELLTAAVTYFRLFDRLCDRPSRFDDLGRELGLAERPLVVLLTALRAMGLLTRDEAGRYGLTPLAREHLVAGGAFDVSGYVGLAADAPGVGAMIDRLTTNRPPGADAGGDGAAFIYREGIESAMEKEASARSLTLALAGRARNVAPVLAERVRLGEVSSLLDVGGGTGIYSIACLQKNPRLRAVVWDRPEVLKVAGEMAAAFGVQDRLQCREGDMFVDPVPEADVILLSNVLHDWDVPANRKLVRRCAEALPRGGRLVIHDVFLNDELDGPLPIALYSAALFSLTEGRAYSAGECREWLADAGLSPSKTVIPTLVHCGVLEAVKLERDAGGAVQGQG